MADQIIFSKSEIVSILNEASRIQTQKELYRGQEGLTEEELVQLADEVGIDRDSLMEALSTYDGPKLEQPFNWINGTSRIQNIATVQGEFTKEQWEEIVQEIRKITGGIGKVHITGKSYEWEQRRRDIGYKHFSFTPEKGKTRIQMVSSWGGLRIITQMIGFLLPFAATAIALDGSNITKFPALLAAGAAGLIIGMPLSRLYLKRYFNRQKNQLNNITSAVSKKIRKITKAESIEIESGEAYGHSVTETSGKTRQLTD